jgi:hypothetical protein
MVRSFLPVAALLMSAALAAPAFAATTLYGSDNTRIYRVDPVTGATVLVGNTGLSDLDENGQGTIIRDLAASRDTLYGAVFSFGPNGITGGVARINPLTGAIISNVALTGLVDVGPNQGLYTLAYDTSTDTLYGSTRRNLYTIDPLTGAATLVGASPGAALFVGLGFQRGTNALYGITETVSDAGRMTTIYRLNAATGGALSVSALNASCGCDITFDPATGRGYMPSNVVDADGNFLSSNLSIFNTGVDSTSIVGPNNSMNGLAFFGAVPEPESWAMMILGFFGIGMAMRHRRRSPHTRGSAHPA